MNRTKAISREQFREHRRRRFRRRGQRAYIRSVYSLPSLATLGNAVCGFAAIYVSTLHFNQLATDDPVTVWFANGSFSFAAYLIFLAMVFDALDGRLARFTRHTTDFGGQLDSLADVISFGAAPAFIAMQLFRSYTHHLPFMVSRLVWAIGAIYMSCAAIRLARFNVSNEHGEQSHFSFLGLPSPGAGATVASFVLMHQAMVHDGQNYQALVTLAQICLWILPVLVLATGLLMVSHIRYPHLINRFLRGKKPIPVLVGALIFLLLVIAAYRYMLALCTLGYVLWGLLGSAYLRTRPKARPADLPTPPLPT